MIVEYVDQKYHDQEEYRYFIECDITEREMEDIKNGRYPYEKVIAYKKKKDGTLVDSSPIEITVSVGLLA